MNLALIRKNFQITLPAEIRRLLHCKIGDMLELVVRKGEIVLKPKALIDKDQAWFWTKEWQEGEKEAEEDVKKGKIKKFKKMEDLIEDLDH